MEKKKAVIIGADGRFCALLAEAMDARSVETVSLTARGQPQPRCGERFEYASQEEMAGLCEKIAREKGAADYLAVSVLTDPGERRDALHGTDTAAWRDAKENSVDLAFTAARTLITPMAQHGGGRALFVGALGGSLSAAGQSISSAMSAGVVMFMQAVAVEGGGRGIAANALLMGPMEGCWGGMEADRRLTAHIPLKRAGRVEEAVSVALFALLDAPDYFSGNTLRLDGALSCAYMRDW